MAIQSPALRRGDTIGIVTLGSPLDADVIRERIRYVEGMGFKTVVGRHVFDQNGFLAGSERERAGDLMAMFADPRVRLILPSRGGVGVEGILPYLDFGLIRRCPKLLSGYSDITVLLNAIAQYSGLITLHSLLLIDFKPDTPAYNFEQFFAAASSPSVPRPILNPPEMPPLKGRVPGIAFGPLVGGNLTSLVGSLGTPYEIDTCGKVLLLEETHEPINTAYRYLEQLKLAGKFRDVAGIVMGECTNCTDAYGKTYDDLIEEFMVPLRKPLVTGIASGHGIYKAALPIGAFVHLDASAGRLTLLESAVC
ncbi:S66 peptidase family protein [Cohnella fermenti]|uniref:LD-carboxypeptidase n=1 Tax=Cohnella fermenti TaxID=2565925 RepID=A0A4S4C6H5_9BACL|nr:LD-carboxypeptidase [Cohnella fermenti]THF83509.1 LD-carboxypeptidase [Cohnella fermenti]